MPFLARTAGQQTRSEVSLPPNGAYAAPAPKVGFGLEADVRFTMDWPTPVSICVGLRRAWKVGGQTAPCRGSNVTRRRYRIALPWQGDLGPKRQARTA